MEIIRYASLRPVPWKNGGGITREVQRTPAAGEPFRWRVSIAEIDSSGPFSNFAGYRRIMVLLKGAGVRLNFADGPSAKLSQAGDLTRFDGARATECELLGGPSTDLNLMVAASMPDVTTGVERLGAPRPLPPGSSGVVLCFPISGTVRWQPDSGGARCLHAWDLAVASSGEGGLIGPDPESENPSVAPLVFFAALTDNSPL